MSVTPTDTWERTGMAISSGRMLIGREGAASPCQQDSPSALLVLARRAFIAALRILLRVMLVRLLLLLLLVLAGHGFGLLLLVEARLLAHGDPCPSSREVPI